MKQVFNNLIQELKINKKLSISVVDTSSFDKIIPAKSGDDLIKAYGSVENFFESIFQKGHRKISITKYSKNGTGLIKKDNLQFDFSEKQTENTQPIAIENKPIQAIPMNNNIGMNGTIGLGFAELLNYGIKANQSEVLIVKNEFLEKENISLKSQIEDLKEERLKSKYDTEIKSNNASMLMGMAETFAPLLMNVLGKGVPATSLNAPAQEVRYLSDIKKNMIAFVENDTTQDVHIQFLFNVIEKVNTDPSFYENVMNLLNPTSVE